MAMGFDQYFHTLKGKNILVMGLGVSNRPLVELLLSYGCSVTGCDRTPREKLDAEVLALEERGCRLQVGEDYLENLQADVVFRTPGMHPDIPALRVLRAGGARITSEMQAFFALCPCNLLAVTGSDGKTTTTTLISEMLKTAGKRVWLGGNIGTPLLPFVPQMKAEDWAVVELSSFQLMDMDRSPHIAVITNLAPNHLDVHKDMQEYIRAKQNIYRYQKQEDKLVLNGDNPITASLSGVGKTRYFSCDPTRKNGAYLVENTIYRDETPVLDIRTIAIPGRHNVENYMAAILALEGIVSDDVIRKVAVEFGGVEHRIELVRVKDGVKFYNDSIASSPSRTIAGLNSFDEKVILIAGGYDKHIPFDELGPVVCEKVKTLFLNGATAEKIRQAVESAPNYAPGHPKIVQCKDFTDAALQSARAAEPGDIVLMSPACAAFDQFKNFMVRGEYYKKLVKEL